MKNFSNKSTGIGHFVELTMFQGKYVNVIKMVFLN